MKNILARANRHVLEELSRSNVLLAFDYDGTLAPIAPSPGEASIRKQTRLLLRELTKLYPVIVISGRAQPDVLRKVEGVGLREVVGNHGIEPWHTTHRYRAQVRRWLPELSDRTRSFEGVLVEDKIYSVAVHYRKARQKKEARSAILEAAAALGDVRVIGGKQVVNILPSGAPHKGLALERERDRLRCDTALYVGDDETDEDVFALDPPVPLLGIRVGSARSSAASYCVRSQAVVDDLLRALVGLRKGASARRTAR